MDQPVTMLVHRRWLRFVPLAVALLACCGGRWVSATPAAFPSAGVEPDLVVARCVNRAQDLGYSVDSVDYERGSLRVVSLRSDAVWLGIRPVPKSTSWLIVQVGDDRTVTIRAYGDLVHEDVARMHPALRSEIDWLAGELERAISDDPQPSESQPDRESGGSGFRVSAQGGQ